MPALRSCELLCDAGQTGCFGDRAECTGQADRCGSAAREHRQLRMDLLRDMRAEGRQEKRLGGQRDRGAGVNFWFTVLSGVVFILNVLIVCFTTVIPLPDGLLLAVFYINIFVLPVGGIAFCISYAKSKFRGD